MSEWRKGEGVCKMEGRQSVFLEYITWVVLHYPTLVFMHASSISVLSFSVSARFSYVQSM